MISETDITAGEAKLRALVECVAHRLLLLGGSGSATTATGMSRQGDSGLAPIGGMIDDMDINAGDIIEGNRSIDEVGHEIRDLVVAVAGGRMTASEELGHREFIRTYKSFEPIGPACLPRVA